MKRLWEHRFMPVVVHVPAVLIAAMAYWLSDDPVFVLITGGICVIATYLSLAWIEARRAPLGLSPLSFYFSWYSISLGISALYMANRIENREIIGFSVTYVHPDDIVAAYIIYLVGSLSLHFGMQILRPLPLEERAPEASGDGEEEGRVSAFGFALLWLAGMAVRLTGGTAFSFLGAAVGVLNWAPLAALCAYSIVRGSRRAPGLKFWLVLSAGMLVEFAFNLRTGSKAYIMYSFLPALWLLAREPAYRRWLIPSGVVLMLFYLVLVAPVVHTSRQLHWSTSDNQADRIIQTYMDDSYAAEDIGEQSNAFLNRQFDPTPVGYLYREVERTGLRYGETLDYMAYAFIPRALWPEKPNVSRGAWFTLYLGQARNEREVTTSTGQTATGELYWNFGLPGVIAGMAFIGLLIGGLWRISGTKPHEDGLLFLLYITLCFGMVDMPEAGSVVVGLVYRVLVIGFLVWVTRYASTILTGRSPKRRAAHG